MSTTDQAVTETDAAQGIDAAIQSAVEGRLKGVPRSRHYSALFGLSCEIVDQIRELEEKITAERMKRDAANQLLAVQGKEIVHEDPHAIAQLSSQISGLRRIAKGIESIAEAVPTDWAREGIMEARSTLIDRAHTRQRKLVKQLIPAAIANGCKNPAYSIHEALQILDPCASELRDWRSRKLVDGIVMNDLDAELRTRAPVEKEGSPYYPKMACRLPRSEIAQMVDDHLAKKSHSDN